MGRLWHFSMSEGFRDGLWSIWTGVPISRKKDRVSTGCAGFRV